MQPLTFRPLAAEEIEVRVAMAKQTGVSLLLYKNSRCDQNVLDETVGPMNWQRHHTRDNANCIVSIWDDDKRQWIEKEDTGVESNTEKEKGLASDSFKRACFNWGIGRELYTAPFIWVKPEYCKALKQNGQKWQCFDSFEVASIEIDNKHISALEIRNTGTNQICFSWPTKKRTQEPTPQRPATLPPEEPRTMTPKEAADCVLTFGPFQGQTLREVYAKDKKYLIQMDLSQVPPKISDAIRTMLTAACAAKEKNKC